MRALHGILGSISMGSWQVATEKKLDLGLSWPGQLGGQDIPVYGANRAGDSHSMNQGYIERTPLQGSYIR